MSPTCTTASSAERSVPPFSLPGNGGVSGARPSLSPRTSGRRVRRSPASRRDPRFRVSAVAPRTRWRDRRRRPRRDHGWSELESGGGGHHRRSPGVHGRDDLLGVDALQVDAGRAEVGVAELALDDVQRHAFAGKFDGVGVAQLMRRKAPPHTGLGGKPTELDPEPGARPERPRVGPSMMQNSGPTGSSTRSPAGSSCRLLRGGRPAW